MTEFPTPPDIEALALDVLRHYMPGEAEYVVSPQRDWNAKLPSVVVTRTGGVTRDPRVDHAVISVNVFHSTRKGASDLARRVQVKFFQAARDGFFSDEGVWSAFETIKSPVPERDGLSGKHPNSFMFDATYDVWARSR